jgi:methionine-rich copper-binding protein CopC
MTTRIVRCAAITAAVASLALPAGALAHAGIKSRSPKPGSTVSAPKTVSVTFDEAVLDAKLSVKSAAGKTVSKGSGSLNAKKTTVKVGLKSGLGAGTYKATAKFLADDGHKETKSWSFSVS